VALFRLIVVFFLAHMGLVAARLTVSLYALANKASTFTVGVILALFSLVPMLIAMPAGRWIDAVGPWRPTLIGILMMLAGMILPAAFTYATADVGPLMVSSALVGTGCMLVMLTMQHLVGERADPGNRQADFSWLALGASLFVAHPFVADPASILKLTSSAPTTLVGAHEKNARQRSSRRRTASSSGRWSKVIRLID